MSYYDEEKKYNEKGIDSDLYYCLEYNAQPFNIDDIEKVLAVFEGANDEKDWRWVIKLTKEAAKKFENKFAYLQGGCDYTGWDCQSSADSRFCKTALKAAEYAKSSEFSSYEDDTFKLGVYAKLVEQLKSQKNKTWRENKDVEFSNELPKL